MEPASTSAHDGVVMRAADGLVPGVLIHTSRHAQTRHAQWHGLDVIAKQPREDLEDERAYRSASDSIVREGAILRNLDHPGIVRVVEILRSPAALLLERVPGRTMREELRQRRRLPAAELCSVGAQLAAALEHLHHHGIVHRDIKPANVMYDGSRAVLIDFHLARAAGEMRGGAGTRLFAAPEQIRGGSVTTVADVWGLGTVLYRAATGRLPFHAEQGHPQLDRPATRALQRLADARYDGDVARATTTLPRDVAELIDRMLAPDARERPPATECRLTLVEHLEALAPVHATRHAS